MSDLRELLAWVEAATGPDRELDALIEVATTPNTAAPDESDPCEPGTYWSIFPGGASLHTAPRYSASLDAALGLVERVRPGWFWRAGHMPSGHWNVTRNTHGWAHISRTDASNCNPADEATGWAETPALALCAALLRSLLDTLEKTT